MKKLQKWISLLLVLTMIFAIFPMTLANELPDDRDDGGSGGSQQPGDGDDDTDLPDDGRNEDENIVAYGYCGGEGDGTNLRWTLYKDGTLTITGTGKMADYDYDINHDTIYTPWHSWRGDIGNAVIQEGVTSIGTYAFYYCDEMTSIDVPESVTAIGRYAFDGCYSMLEIIVDDGNLSYSDEGGILFNKEKSLLICYPKGKTQNSYTIPSGVITIGEEAFSNCVRLRTVVIPNSVRNIGNFAFASCFGLTSVTIPNGVMTIGGRAFLDCTNLTHVTIPDSVINIGENAFSHCTKLSSIEIPDSVVTIGQSAFFDCVDLNSVYFKGNAPEVTAADFYNRSFELDTTLYYIPGTTGWTDSDAYDAEAGTWNGYKLAVWEKNKVELTEQDGEIEIKVVADGPATAMVATYNENGKFIKCVEKEIQPGETTWTVAAADLLRVFLLDDDHAPLYTPAEYPAK